MINIIYKQDCGTSLFLMVLDLSFLFKYTLLRPYPFDKVAIHLPEKKTFTIIAKNNDKPNKYIEKVTLSVQMLTVPFFK